MDRLTKLTLKSCVIGVLIGTVLPLGSIFFNPTKIKNRVIMVVGGDYSLKYKSKYERYKAAEDLGERGRKSAIPRLESMLKNPFEDIEVKEAAAISIRKLAPYKYFKEKMGGSINNDKEHLVAVIHETLKGLPHSYRYHEWWSKKKGVIENGKEEKLNVLDLNIVSKLLDELKRKDTLSQIGNLVKADVQTGTVKLKGIRKDGKSGHYTVTADKTELGGLVKIIEKNKEKRFFFESYEPKRIKDNGSYSESKRSIIDYAVCDFHFHALKKEGNKKLAGPSYNDLNIALVRNRDGVVITYIGTDKQNKIQVNIDYFTKDKIIIDLGNYNTGIKLD